MTKLAAIEQLPPPPGMRSTYLNRELSWLAFNERVLEEAFDPGNPLIERFRFLTIFHTNLDEFFMIRVSGLKQQLASGMDVVSRDGLSPRQQLQRITERVLPAMANAQRCLMHELLPAFRDVGVTLCHYQDLTDVERSHLDRAYRERVHPVLTPLAVGPTNPFPFISNLSLNLALFVRSPEGEQRFARVKLPLGHLPRLLSLDGDDLEPPVRLLPLEELVAANLDSLFPGMTCGTPWLFRVTRDADLEIKEDEADDLLPYLQQELRRRRFGQAVRLEIQAGAPAALIDELSKGLGLDDGDVARVDGIVGTPTLSRLLSIDAPELKYPPFVPRRSEGVKKGDNLFSSIRSTDLLLHHPFDSFGPVVDFVRAAANDPKVVAIKQTLYRTSGDSPIIHALEEAIENGKQVAAVVELKARFDEENNIVWAGRLEQAGVHVIYGAPGLKTHAKLCMVVRREGAELVRYCHVGTGNYNAITARVYTDLGLLTANPEIAEEIAEVFNRLTGFSRPESFQHLLVAPRFMKDRLLDLIRAETAAARGGEPSRIIAKCNAVTDRDVIEALYEASGAGVQIDLLVRGICCLVPAVPGTSDNIRVRSVVGRFLEHSRVYWFENRGDPAAYIGSADWMGRNLIRRVEVLVPVRSSANRTWLRALLERYLIDVGRTRLMGPDGSYTRLSGEGPDVHDDLLEQLL